MPELMTSILGSISKLTGNYIIHARRYDMRLPLTVSLLDSKRSGHGSPAVSGYLRDISKTGVSLVMPSILFGNRHLTGGNFALRIVIEFPDGAMSFQAVPVRYDRFHETDEQSYIIGARITDINEADRRQLVRYIEQAKKKRTVSLSLEQNAKPV